MADSHPTALIAYLDSWLAATLSLVTIVLAILGLVIALAAIWGYATIQRQARRIAQDAANAKLSDYLDRSDIKQQLRAMVDQKVAEESDRLFSDLALSWQFPLREDGLEGSVGREYPPEEGQS